MSAALAIREKIIDPAPLFFRARCEAVAYLVSAGAIALRDAVDGLQADAVSDGLVDAIGQDAVQAIMSTALGCALAYAHTMAEPAPPLAPIEEQQPPRRRELAASTIDAFKYVVSLRDPNHLRQWLARRSIAERREFKRMVTQR
jgi:hypothetical protein